jgi:hypothetical protein
MLKTKIWYVIVVLIAVVSILGWVFYNTSSNKLRIISATYGNSCNVPTGNATTRLKKACNGKKECKYRLDVAVLGDPANGCAKDFIVEFDCGEKTNLKKKFIPPEAGVGGNVVRLRCPS